MDRTLTVIMWLSIALLAGALVSLRRQHIRVEISVSWLVAAVLLLGLTQSKVALNWIGQAIGVESGVSALFLVSATVFVSVIYRLSIRVSGLKDSNVALTQRIAILEYKLETLSLEGKR